MGLDTIFLENLDNMDTEIVAEQECPDFDTSPYDAETMDMEEYVLDPHVGIGGISADEGICTDIPEDVIEDNVNDSDEWRLDSSFLMDDIPEDTGLTEEQIQRLADLDEGYAAVSKDDYEIMEDILSKEDVSTSDKIAQLKYLREMAASDASAYHSYRREILDDTEESGAVLKKTLHR